MEENSDTELLVIASRPSRRTVNYFDVPLPAGAPAQDCIAPRNPAFHLRRLKVCGADVLREAPLSKGSPVSAICPQTLNSLAGFLPFLLVSGEMMGQGMVRDARSGVILE